MNAFALMATLGLDSSAYESGLSKAKSMAGTLGSGISKGLTTAAKVGVAAVGAAATAVTAFGVASVKTGMDFDKSMSQVFATMGDKAEEVVKKGEYAGQTASAALRDFAQEMGRTTAFSATQAADALNYMALAGYDAETSMQMLPNVLNMAAAGGMELARASDMITDTQSALGLDMQRTTQMVDEFAKAASTGNTSVEQLGDAFLTVGGLARELNGGMVTLADGTQKPVDGVQELEIALTAMANAGIKGSEAGTHMRNMLLKLSSPTSDGAKALENMGVKVFDAEGKMRSLSDVFGDLSGKLGEMTQEQKIQTISDLFNTRDLASAEALLNAVNSDWDAIGESILDAEGAAQKMADVQLDNLAGDVTLFKSALEGAKIAVSDVLAPALREFVQFGTNGLSELTSAFKEGGLTGAMKSLGKILSNGLKMIVKKMPQFVKAGAELMGALGKGLMDNLDVITDALSEVLDYLIDVIGDNLPDIMSSISEVIQKILKTISDRLPEITPVITDFIVGLAQIIADNAEDFVKVVVAIAGAIGEGIIKAAPIIAEKAPEIMNALVEAIKENPEALVVLGPFLINKLIGGITGAVGLLKGVGSIIGSPIVEGITTHITTGLSSLGTTIGTKLSGLGASLSSGLSSIASFATADMGTVMASGGASAVGMAAAATVGSVAAAFGGAEIGKSIGAYIFPEDEELYESYSGIMGTLEMLKDFGIAFADLFSMKWDETADQISATWGFVKDTFSNSWGSLKDGASGLWEGIKEVFSGIGEWFSEKFTEAGELASTAWGTVKDKFSESWESTKTVFSNVGSWFSEKFTQARESASNSFASIKDKMASIKDSITNVFSNIGSWFSEKFRMASEAIKNAFSGITTFFSSLKDKIVNTFTSMKEKFSSIGKNIVAGLKEGIAGSWEKFTEWLSERFGDITSIAKGILGIESPSKVMANEVGRWIPEGVAVGIEDGMGVLKSAVDGMYSEIVSGADLSNSSSITGTSASSDGSANEIISLLQEIRDGGNVKVVLEGDADRIFRVVQDRATVNYRMTGQKDLVLV